MPPLPPIGATAILLLLLSSSSLSSLSSLSKLSNKKQKLNTAIHNNNVPLLAVDYPHLSCALGQEDGFNPVDLTTQKIMQLLLAELLHLLSSDDELNAIDSQNNKLSYIQVPKTSNNRSFHNTKEWLDVAIKNCLIQTRRHLQICLPQCQAPLPLLQGLSPCCMKDPKNCCMQAYECKSILIHVVCITS